MDIYILINYPCRFYIILAKRARFPFRIYVGKYFLTKMLNEILYGIVSCIVFLIYTVPIL